MFKKPDGYKNINHSSCGITETNLITIDYFKNKPDFMVIKKIIRENPDAIDTIMTDVIDTILKDNTTPPNAKQFIRNHLDEFKRFLSN